MKGYLQNQIFCVIENSENIFLYSHFSYYEGTLELLPWENPCREELLRRKARFVKFPSYKWEIISIIR